MKKHFNFLLTLIMTLSILITSAIPSYADSGVQPRLQNASDATVAFAIDDDTGIGYFGFEYSGKDEYFTMAKMTVYIQKKTFLFFWTDIADWTNTSTNLHDDMHTSFNLDGKGTYRAKFKLEFFGNTGVVDVIEESIQDVYD